MENYEKILQLLLQMPGAVKINETQIRMHCPVCDKKDNKLYVGLSHNPIFVNRGLKVLGYGCKQCLFSGMVGKRFFDRLGININLNNPITVYNPDFSDSLSNIKSLTLNNVFNRATFKRWMESYVIPTLKRDYPNNTFIKDLTPDSTRSQIGSTKIFYKLPVDLNKVVGDYNEVLYDNYVLDFNNLRQFKFEGNNIGDLFFIYNLLISNNSFGGKTITRIFEDMVREADSNSIISKFLEFESNLSNLNIDYDINDLNIRFKPQKRVNILSNSSEVETSDGKTFEVFTKDNTSMLFFRDKTNKEFSRKVNTVHDKLMELFDNDKIQIKLSCDE